jgi:hypothetical protein
MGDHVSTPSPDNPDPGPNSAGTGGPLDAADFGERMKFVRSGHREALGALFQTCRSYLLLVANRGLPEDVRVKVGASDLVQDTFLQA